MKSAVAALVALEYAAIVSAASPPRGVGPDFAKFYQDSKTFKCISNPTINLPFSQVNDDFCDCPDGSDEPGTAACAHLSPLSPHTLPDGTFDSNITAGLPGFYCQNKGHISNYIPFTNVNDGICDHELCCDGSEEWEGIGGVKCKDRCDEIGKEWRKHDDARKKSASAALNKRNELVKEAAKLKQLVKDRISTLQTQVQGTEIKVQQMEQEFKETQRKEAGKVVTSGGSKGGKLGQLVEIGKRRTEELRNHLVSTRSDLTSSKTKLQQLEGILKTFHEEYNPNFNDEGVKRAVRAWEDYVASSGTPAESNAANERDLDEIAKPDSDNGLNWELYDEEEAEDETAVLYSFVNYLPPSLRSWVDEKLRDFRHSLIQGGILADSVKPGQSESKKVTDARKALDSEKKVLEDAQKSLKDSQEDMDKDFGPDDVFRALKDKCIETDSGEYTYELCFLGKTNQKPKKGGGHTNMGTFTRIERIVVDEEVPPNGKGLGSGERIAMKHENGQHCWNGPNRMTTVILACSETDEIWKIFEEEKCVYRMEVGTPAVCEVQKKAAGGSSSADGGRDEL